MRSQRGFTFVELLVTVTIIAVLMGAAAVSYADTSKRSRNAKRKADLEVIRSALEICRSNVNEYPAAIYTSVTCGGVTTLQDTPKDPKDASNYTYTPGAAPITTYTLTAPLCEGITCSVANP